MTHLDPRSVVSGVVQAHAVYDLLSDVSRESFLTNCYGISQHYEAPLTPQYKGYEKGTLTEKLKWVYENRDRTSEEAHTYLGSSSAVFSSYPFALFMFQKYWDDPLKGLLETVNYGGDCDTTGAIFGTLAGARHGLSIFPKEWIAVTKDVPKLRAVADTLYAQTQERT